MRNKYIILLLIVIFLLLSFHYLGPKYLQGTLSITPRPDDNTGQKIQLVQDNNQKTTPVNQESTPVELKSSSTVVDKKDSSSVDKKDSSLVDTGSIPDERQCEKHKNFVFVKTHKTGTSTTVNILYNFGINYGLNYAIYPYTHQLYIIKPKYLMKLPANETYNIMCQHMVFNKAAVESVMPDDTYYFSLLREPTKAFISFFIFYNKDKM